MIDWDNISLECQTEQDIKILDLEFIVGNKIGMLGIQLSTRRRNRVNGLIDSIGSNNFSTN